MSVHFFQELTRSLPEACFLISGAGEIMAINPAGARLLGREVVVLVGKPLTGFVTDNAEKVSHYLKICFRNREPVLGALTWRAAGNKAVPCRCYGHLIITSKDEASPPILLRCEPKTAESNKFIALNRTLEDLQASYHKLANQSELLRAEIAERSRVEIALKDAHARLLTVLNSLDAIVYVADMETYEILFVNQHVRDLFGEIEGQQCWQTIQAGQSGPCDFCSNKCLLDSAGNPSGIHHWEFQNTTNGHWYDIRDRAIRWLDGRIVRMEIAIDITERKRMMEEIMNLNEKLELRVTERTAELEVALQHQESFAYSISHDLRSPLRAIDGYARILNDDFAAALPEQVRDYLDRMSMNVNRMGRLIDDLLRFSRLTRQPIDKQETDVHSLVAGVLRTIAADLPDTPLPVTIGPLPPCQADPSLLRQVYANLIGNALKYTSRCDQPRIEIGAMEQDGKNIYFVKDNGVGFDTKYADKLFGVFQRLHGMEEFEGTGVGLAIVHNIITRHGGKIWAESEVGRGATFYFAL